MFCNSHKASWHVEKCHDAKFVSCFFLCSHNAFWYIDYIPCFVKTSNELERVTFSQCHHTSLMDFVVPPPGRGRSVSDF
jgi:hypothetical protein